MAKKMLTPNSTEIIINCEVKVLTLFVSPSYMSSQSRTSHQHTDTLFLPSFLFHQSISGTLDLPLKATKVSQYSFRSYGRQQNLANTFS